MASIESGLFVKISPIPLINFMGLDKISQLLKRRNLPKYIPKLLKNIIITTKIEAIFVEYLIFKICSIWEIEYIPKRRLTQAELKIKKVS